jgi:hypothetical protein
MPGCSEASNSMLFRRRAGSLIAASSIESLPHAEMFRAFHMSARPLFRKGRFPVEV